MLAARRFPPRQLHLHTRWCAGAIERLPQQRVSLVGVHADPSAPHGAQVRGAQCDESRGVVGSATLHRFESRERVPAPGRLAPRAPRAQLLLRKELFDERRQRVGHALQLGQSAVHRCEPSVPLGLSAQFPLLFEIEDGHRSALPTPRPVRVSE
jgi:hypothetical protein